MIDNRLSGPYVPPPPPPPPKPEEGTAAVAKKAAVTKPQGPNPQQVAQELNGARDQLVKALEKGDHDGAKRAIQKGLDLAQKTADASSDPALKAQFAEAHKAFKEIEGQVNKAIAEAKPPEPPKEEKKGGIFGFVGDIAKKVGGAVESAARFVTKPLTWVADKVIGPVRDVIGKALGGLKDAIDNSIGKIPVIGSAVRFTTGLGASVVGLVDGVVTAATRPVDTIKGLGQMAWQIGGLVPGPKMIYDGLVHGKNPIESWKDSASNTLELGKAMFGGAIQDFKDGNYAGMAGRLTGDIGSMFLGGAGAGAAAARLAALAGKGGRIGKVAAVASRGLSGLSKVVTVDSKLMELGAKGVSKVVGKGASIPGAVAGRLDDVGRVADDVGKVGRMDGAVAAATKIDVPLAQLDQYKYFTALGKQFDLNIPSSKRPAGYDIRGTLAGVDPKGGLHFRADDGTVYQVPPDRLAKFEAGNPGFVRAREAASVNVDFQAMAKAGESFDLNIPSSRNPDGYQIRGSLAGVDEAGTLRFFDEQGTLYQVPQDRLARFQADNPDFVAAAQRASGGPLPPGVVNTRPENLARLWDMTGDEGRIAMNGSHVADQARRALDSMNPAQRAQFDGMMNAATSAAERTMLHRAVAMKYPLEDVGRYADAMRNVAAGNYPAAGITNPQMAQYLSQLTPEQRVLRLSTLEGLEQHFTTSCNPTSFQIVRGEVDPIYAFQGNMNPQRLIDEQKRLLEMNNGVAVPRVEQLSFFDKVKEALGMRKKAQGVGTYPVAMADELNRLSPWTGIRYEPRGIADGMVRGADGNNYARSSPQSRAAAVREIERGLKQGKPTEIFVRWIDRQSGVDRGGHAIAAVDTRTLPDGRRQILLHDPEHPRGTDTVWVDARDLEAGHLGPSYEPSGTSGELDGYLHAR